MPIGRLGTVARAVICPPAPAGWVACPLAAGGQIRSMHLRASNDIGGGRSGGSLRRNNPDDPPPGSIKPSSTDQASRDRGGCMRQLRRHRTLNPCERRWVERYAAIVRWKMPDRLNGETIAGSSRSFGRNGFGLRRGVKSVRPFDHPARRDADWQARRANRQMRGPARTLAFHGASSARSFARSRCPAGSRSGRLRHRR